MRKQPKRRDSIAKMLNFYKKAAEQRVDRVRDFALKHAGAVTPTNRRPTYH